MTKTKTFPVTVWGPNLGANDVSFHVHGVDCPDTKKAKYQRSDGGWTITIESKRDAVLSVYDPESFDFDPDTELDMYRDDFKFFPCAGRIPEVATATPATSNTETQENQTMTATKTTTKKATTTKAAPKKATPKATPKAKSFNFGGYPGCAMFSRNAETGSVLSIWFNAQGGPAKGNAKPWAVQCETHGTVKATDTRTEAREYRLNPTTFCTKCAAAAKKGGVKDAPAKKSAATKAPAKKAASKKVAA